MKKDLNKWNPLFWIGRVNVIKISIFPKWIYRFNAIPVKISWRFLVDIDKISLKFIWKDIETIVAKTISKEMNKVGKINLPDSKTCIATAIETVWYWQNCRHTYQWNRKENLERDQHNCAQMIFDKHAKAIQWRKDVFNKWYWCSWDIHRPIKWTSP